MAKIQKQLHFSCPTCSSTFQLLEIHKKETGHCSANCQEQWAELLSKHYQDCIILNLAKKEAEEERND